VVVGHIPQPTEGPLFQTDLPQTQAAQILRDSRLCAGTLAEPQRTLWSELPEIRLESGRESTVHGTTNSGTDYFDASTDGGGGDVPDALYRIQVNDWSVLYADTFSGGVDLGSTGATNPGTDFDTVLYVMQATDDNDSDPLLVASSWETTGGAFDDSLCARTASDVNFIRQSQLTDVLAPGKKYILGVTGFGDQRGKFNLHVQSVPAPRNGQLVKPQDAAQTVSENGLIFNVFSAKPFEPTAAEQSCVNGINSNEPFDPACMYSTQAPLVCQRTDSGEFGFVSVSCPEFPGEPFKFRVEATSFPFGPYADDPVAQYWDGQLRHDNGGYVCSDDSKFPFFVFPFFSVLLDSFSSEIGTVGQVRPESAETFLPSGAGVRVFYAHQFQIFMNWQNLGYTLKLPSDATNDIWTR
jgi:hypothetical protein